MILYLYSIWDHPETEYWISLCPLGWWIQLVDGRIYLVDGRINFFDGRIHLVDGVY